MSEACRPSESLVAQPACVRPIVTVLSLVRLQYETSLEGFATCFTDIRAHVAVLRVPVSAKGICSVGAVLTLVTGIWFLPCRKQIHVFVATLAKSISDGSLISSSIIVNFCNTCVFAHVILQLSCPLAFVAALRTKVLLLFLMNPHMKLCKKWVWNGVGPFHTFLFGITLIQCCAPQTKTSHQS